MSELSFFELYQARTWVLNLLRHQETPYVCINLALNKIKEESWKWFLEQMAHEDYHDWLLFYKDGNYMTFTKSISNRNLIHWYLHFFHDEESNSLYVGLYDKDGKRTCENCLIIWNRNAPHITNPGYAHGRCPDQIQN